MPALIDSHVHIMPPWRLAALVRWMLKAYPRHPVSESITAIEIVNDLKSLGVSHFFNFIYPLKKEETESLNRFNLELCDSVPGAIPFASLNPDTLDMARYAEKLLYQDRFIGFKFHPFVQRFDPWDPRMDPLYRVAQEAGKPVFLHTGFELFYKLEMPIQQLVKLVQRYPSLPFVFVHMAFPEFDTCFRLMEEYSDLYLDATNVLAFLRPEFQGVLTSLPNGNHLIDLLLQGIEKYSPRIMFGSDYPVGMGSLNRIYKDLEESGLSPQAQQNLKSNTAFEFVNRFQPEFDWGKDLQSNTP